MPVTLTPLSTREVLLEGAMDVLSKTGAETFTPVSMCSELNIKPSLVNYYFGSREGLIREAAVVSYERYGSGFTRAWEQHGHEPRLHFTAALQHQIDWTVTHRPIMHLITGGRVEDFTADQRARIARVLLLNVSLLATAIGGIIDGSPWRRMATPEDAERRPEVRSATGMVSWMISGHAIWKAGPLLHVAQQIDSAKAINKVHAEVMVMAFEIVRHYAECTAGPQTKG